MPTTLNIPEKPTRNFLPNQLSFNTWSELETYFDELKNRSLNSVNDLEKWLIDRSELEAVLEEELAWRYIRMNIDTTDEQLSKDFNFFVQEIEPNVAPYSNAYDKKLMECSFLSELSTEKYRVYLRDIKKDIEIYREENIPLKTQLKQDSQKYGVIAAKQTVEIDGKEITMQKAATYLKNTDRSIRKAAFEKIVERRLKDVDELHQLFSELSLLRHKVAKNADFSNYRDYMFEAMGRFDYSVSDCYDFHESIATEIVPIIKQFQLERQEKMGISPLKPWDTEVDITGKPALKPFEGGKELTQKTIDAFNKLHPFFGECIAIMDEMGYLDLESKQGKAPGGFNYPLHEIGVPFIYMNAVGSLRDVVTMVHEGGHAIHSFLSRDLELTGFKSTPSEVAELASMSMELLSMEHWDVFFSDEKELKRAKREQLEKILSILPWIATVDQFQHWLYENPDHTIEERTQQWKNILDRYSTNTVDYSGFESHRETSWQRQLHIFEVPFYYIEYGMAQLGAIAVWRNYKSNPKKALQQYQDALKLGYTKSISEIYECAGIKFDFSREYVSELVSFVKYELSCI